MTDEPGWHGRELRRALAAHGYDSVYVSLNDCRFDLTGLGHIVIPEFKNESPAGVFVRGIDGGALEQVILRLDFLHGLRELGVVVYNDARAIERTVDKAMTSLLLKRAGIPTPNTWVCESEQEARAVVVREVGLGKPVVMKPLFGSQGKGVTLVKHPRDLPDVWQGFGGVYYLQSFIENGTDEWRDWRVFVIGGRAQAAMVRRNNHWITNRAQGARCEAVPLEEPLVHLAEEATRAVGADYAGVDLLQDEEGRFLVSEVNSIPAWQGLQGACGFNVAERLVEHFLSRIAAASSLEVV